MKKFTDRQVLQTLLVLGIVICFCPSAGAAPKTVWQIGKSDASPSEFNTGKEGPPLFGSRYPTGELLYVVGKSTPEVDWPAYQEGSVIGKAGSHPHPYPIQFDLPEAPQGVYTLKAGLLSETARLARLQVEINGHRGLFYQHPKLSYTGGDREMVVSPISSVDTIAFDFPARFLQKGTNKLVLTAVDGPATGDAEVHSAITYDALELDQDSSRKYSPPMSRRRSCLLFSTCATATAWWNWWTFTCATTPRCSTAK